MDFLITPTKKKNQWNRSSQFVCEGDGHRAREINQTWFSFSFSHLLIEFKIKLTFLEYLLCSLLEQCGNEENGFLLLYFIYFTFLVLIGEMSKFKRPIGIINGPEIWPYDILL